MNYIHGEEADKANRAGRADKAGRVDRAVRCDTDNTGRFFQPIHNHP